MRERRGSASLSTSGMGEHRFTFTRRVEFADTDVAGIMHFSNFFRFMEVTEHAFYRSLGFSVHPFKGREIPGAVGNGEARVGWPRVQASCDFRLPLEFEEEVEIELLVEEIRRRTVRYCFRFYKMESEKVVAAIGRFTVVCVSFDERTKKMAAVEIPPTLRNRIEAAPAALLEEADAN
ncbi:MAG: thioesterase family protein [Verrucomicrobiota bacterium]